MRVIIISDTHISDSENVFPPVILKEIRKFDLCIHCGDFTIFPVIEAIKKETDFIGVCGNMDEPDIQKKLPNRQIITIDGLKVGITHGNGSNFNMLEYLQNEFRDVKLDICFFGHTHQALNKKIKNTIFFNPGSLTDKIFAQYNSYGILETNKGKIIKLEVIKVG